MKIIRIKTTNFGSYPEFEMDFDNMNLALIYGATGSGKSTVMDMVCWCLYGETAKGLNANEVRAWNSTEPTTGFIELDNGLTITRVRADRSSQNDLYFNNQERGKDATETQKLIDQKIGADCNTFVTACYFNEFADTGNFFIAKAKDRRELFERIASTSFAEELSERASSARKTAKAKLQAYDKAHSEKAGELKATNESRDSTIRASDNWERGRARTLLEIENLSKNYKKEAERKLKVYQEKHDNFEQNKNQQIDDLLLQIEVIEGKIQHDDFQSKIEQLEQEAKKERKCKSCNQAIRSEAKTNEIWELKQRQRENANHIANKERLIERLAEIQASVNNYAEEIKNLEEQENPYIAQLELERKRKNPFIDQLETIINKGSELGLEVAKLTTQVRTCKERIEDLSHIYDLTATLRGELLKRTVTQINDAINSTLEIYFDSELRVYLEIDEDDLEVRIEKSGNECSYRQLSKGQRQLLKLSFVLAVQRAVSDKVGIKFQNLFFDEALDGLDETLKIKAYALFQALSLDHSSILVIDHSQAFHNLFDKRFHVTMLSDKSSIDEEITD